MQAAADGGRIGVEGDLTLAGATQPIAFDLAIGDDGTLSATAVVTQTRWGMKPYSALFGALKVLDDVEVVLDGHRCASVAIDGLRVEPALDARRQRAGAVRVEGDVLDRLDLRGVAAVARDPRAVATSVRVSGGASSAMPASSRALSRIFALALAIAAGVPPDGLVL